MQVHYIYTRRQFKRIAQGMVDHCLCNSDRGFYSGHAEGQTDIMIDQINSSAWRVEWYEGDIHISNAAKKYMCRYAGSKGVPVLERSCVRTDD